MEQWEHGALNAHACKVVDAFQIPAWCCNSCFRHNAGKMIDSGALHLQW